MNRFFGETFIYVAESTNLFYEHNTCFSLETNMEIYTLCNWQDYSGSQFQTRTEKTVTYREADARNVGRHIENRLVKYGFIIISC